MKSLLFLLSALILLGHLAGCAASPRVARGTTHTIEPTLPSVNRLPFPADNPGGPPLFNGGFTDTVTDLDKRDVLQRFGRPAERLTSDLWIYWRFYAPEDAAENGGHDTLVVSFARGRVSTMKLVRGDVLRAHLAGRWSAEELAQR